MDLSEEEIKSLATFAKMSEEEFIKLPQKEQNRIEKNFHINIALVETWYNNPMSRANLYLRIERLKYYVLNEDFDSDDSFRVYAGALFRFFKVPDYGDYLLATRKERESKLASLSVNDVADPWLMITQVTNLHNLFNAYVLVSGDNYVLTADAYMMYTLTGCGTPLSLIELSPYNAILEELPEEIDIKPHVHVEGMYG